MSLLGATFSLGGLLRSPWLYVVALSLVVGAFFFGYRTASTACERDKLASLNKALEQANQAVASIGDVRVQAERKRTATREDFKRLEENFGNVDYLQELLVANGCILDPDGLRDINESILRTRRAD